MEGRGGGGERGRGRGRGRKRKRKEVETETEAGTENHFINLSFLCLRSIYLHMKVELWMSGRREFEGMTFPLPGEWCSWCVMVDQCHIAH